MTIHVEYDPSAMRQTDADRARLAERVRRKLKNDTNVNFEVEVLEPYTLERAVSKARRVDDRRPRHRPASPSNTPA